MLNVHILGLIKPVFVVVIIFERRMTHPVKLYVGTILELPFLVFLACLHMTKISFEAHMVV